MRERLALLVAGSFLFVSPPAQASRTIALVSLTVGECSLSAESDDEWSTLRLRAQHPASKECAIDRDSMLSLLGSALAKKAPPPAAGGYTTLYVGRLIDYPWMSSYLATTASRDSAWISKSGTPVSGDINRYVDDLLFRQDFIAQMDPVLRNAGYAVVGVTVEKVLVGEVHDLPGRLPFDAQVWFRIVKR